MSEKQSIYDLANPFDGMEQFPFDVTQAGGGGKSWNDDIFGGSGDKGGASSNGGTDTGGGTPTYDNPTLEEEAERIYNEMQEAAEKAAQAAKNKKNWLLYAAIAAGIIAIIK